MPFFSSEPEPVILADYSALQLAIDKLTGLAKKIGQEDGASEKTAAYVKEMVASGKFAPFNLHDKFKKIEQQIAQCMPGPNFHLARQGLLTTIQKTFQKITDQLDTEAWISISEGNVENVERLLKAHDFDIHKIFKNYQRSYNPRIYELLILTGVDYPDVSKQIISSALYSDNPEWLELANKYFAGHRLRIEDLQYSLGNNFRAFDHITDSGMALSEDSVYNPHSGFAGVLSYKINNLCEIFSYIFNGGNVSSFHTKPFVMRAENLPPAKEIEITIKALRIRDEYLFSLLGPALATAIPGSSPRELIGSYIGPEIVAGNKHETQMMRQHCYRKLNHEAVDELHRKQPSEDLERMKELDLDQHPFDYLNESPAFAEHMVSLNNQAPNTLETFLRTVMKSDGRALEKWMPFIRKYYKPTTYYPGSTDNLLQQVRFWSKNNLDMLADNGVKLYSNTLFTFTDRVVKPITTQLGMRLPLSYVNLIPALVLNGVKLSTFTFDATSDALNKTYSYIANNILGKMRDATKDYLLAKLQYGLPLILKPELSHLFDYWFNPSDYTDHPDRRAQASLNDPLTDDRRSIRTYVYKQLEGHGVAIEVEHETANENEKNTLT